MASLPRIRVNVLALVKDPDRYVFLYDDDPASSLAMLDTLSRFAGDPDLSFSWHDAAELSSTFRAKRSEPRV